MDLPTLFIVLVFFSTFTITLCIEYMIIELELFTYLSECMTLIITDLKGTKHLSSQSFNTFNLLMIG